MQAKFILTIVFFFFWRGRGGSGCYYKHTQNLDYLIIAPASCRLAAISSPYGTCALPPSLKVMQSEKRVLGECISQVFLKLRSNAAEHSPFQLRLPVQKVGRLDSCPLRWLCSLLPRVICLAVDTYIESMFHPSVLLDFIQIDEHTRVGISMCSCEDAPPTTPSSLQSYWYSASRTRYAKV